MFDIFNHKKIRQLQREVELLKTKDKAIIAYYGCEPVYITIDNSRYIKISTVDKEFITLEDTIAKKLRDFLCKHFKEETNDRL